jgi:carbonic anhydrase
MAATPTPVRSPADILPEWRDTPVADLLAAVNLGTAPAVAARPAILVARCWEDQAPLGLPPGFALELRAPGAVLKRSAFDVSWAIAEAGVRAIAVVGHDDCGLVGLRGRREDFVARLVAVAGWERPAAEQHFDHWSDLVEVADPAEAAVAEARRLRLRYPGIPVAPLLRRSADGVLLQLTG